VQKYFFGFFFVFVGFLWYAEQTRPKWGQTATASRRDPSRVNVGHGLHFEGFFFFPKR